jgi:putative hydrolase of HD superfamily
MDLNALLLKIYEAAGMQRWNDQIRTIEFTELDKQSHKMITAYILGKCQQDRTGTKIDWIRIIETGIYEFIKRIILTDLKPPLIYRIREDRKKYEKLNQWVFERISPYLEVLGGDFIQDLKQHLMSSREDTETRIVNAAHFYVTDWEFNIIRQTSPGNFLHSEIDQSINTEKKEYWDIESIKYLEGDGKDLRSFLDIAGQLRFQQRWSHLYRIPRTSVLGHMLIVAMFSYLFSYIAGAGSERRINNYFTGLFHDLPEVLTRDIINPVKKSVEGLDELIKEYEVQEMEKKIYKLLPENWHKEIKRYTENEFSDSETRDGTLVKGADDLAAFMEAYLALTNGIRNEALVSAVISLRKKYKGKNDISGINFEAIYKGFKGSW